MNIINAAPFVGDQADDFMDYALGLDNTTEIVGAPFAMRPSAHGAVDIGDVMSVGEVVRAVVSEAQQSREETPELDVIPFSQVEAVDDSLVDVIVGASVPGNDIFQPVASSPFPLTESLYRQFSASSPDGKVVRLDTEDSYAKFRASGVQRSLEQRVDDLELALARHTSDGHGGDRPYRPIALQLAPSDEGCIECWQEDDMICCSMRLLGPDGNIKIATAATPVEAHTDEVMGYVERSGIDVLGVLPILPHLVGMLGGGSLIPKLASAAPALLRRPEAKDRRVFVGKIKGGSNPSSAALLSLLQMAQSGDWQAIKEWGTFAAIAPPPLEKKMRRVKNALLDAQGA